MPCGGAKNEEEKKELGKYIKKALLRKSEERAIPKTDLVLTVFADCQNPNVVSF
jgi:hypothetical protein